MVIRTFHALERVQLDPTKRTVPSFSLIYLSNSIKFYRKVLITVLKIPIEFHRNIPIFVVDMVIRTFSALGMDSIA